MGGEGGGGRIMPAATLNLNNVYNILENALRLIDFFRKLSGNNLMPSVTVPWQPFFDRPMENSFLK